MSSSPEKVRDSGLPGPETIITTFYSFKGGVGRSMALYAVANRLAARRRRVLMVDADLEAPGLSIAALSRDEVRSGEGLAEIVGDIVSDLLKAVEAKRPLREGYLEEQTKRVSSALRLLATPPQEKSELLDRVRKELPYRPFRDSGRLAILPVGRVYDNYATVVERIPLQQVFAYSFEGAEGLEELFRSAGVGQASRPRTLGDLLNAIVRHALKNANAMTETEGEAPFDYILVDSRTGLADISAFCVRGLADNLVLFSSLNEQNLTGLRWILGRLDPQRRDAEHLVPVLSPVPEGEVVLLAKRLTDFGGVIRESGITSSICLLHYHPRVALSEEPYTEAILRLTRLASDYDGLAERVQAMNRDRPEQWLGRSLQLMREPFREGETADDRHAAVMRDLVEGALTEPEQVERVCAAVVSQTGAQEGRDPRLLDFLRLLVALAPADHRYLRALANGLSNLARQQWVASGADRGRALFAEAFAKYGEAVRHKPDLHEEWYNWGSDLGTLARLEWEASGADRGRGLFAEAFAKFENAQRIAPDGASHWAGAAFCHSAVVSLVGNRAEPEGTRHNAEAERCWQEAERLGGNVARFWRAAAAEQAGQRDEALRLLADVVIADPRAAAAAKREFWFRSLRGDPRFAEIVAGK